jgi:hypothetical protein
VESNFRKIVPLPAKQDYATCRHILPKICKSWKIQGFHVFAMPDARAVTCFLIAWSIKSASLAISVTSAVGRRPAYRSASSETVTRRKAETASEEADTFGGNTLPAK